MIRPVRVACRTAVAGMLLLALACPYAQGEDGVWGAGRGVYVGIFGGAGTQNVDGVTQSGTALFPAASGGPLLVNATANPGGRAVGLAGLHVGYEWSGAGSRSEGGGWALLPAAEFEGFYLGGTQRARVHAKDARFSARRLQDVHQRPNRGRLAGAVRAEQRKYTSWPDGKADVADGLDAPVAAGQVRDINRGIHWFLTSMHVGWRRAPRSC